MTSWGDRAIPRQEPNRGAHKQTLRETLTTKFREAMKRLLDRAPAPQPRTRRRSSGEADGAFRLAARAILRPISRLPFVAHATAFLYDTLGRLHLLEWDESADKHDVFSGQDGSDNNHLSPRL